MGKNLGAIGNILNITSRNSLGTHWEQKKNTKNSMFPSLLPKKLLSKSTQILAKRKWPG